MIFERHIDATKTLEKIKEIIEINLRQRQLHVVHRIWIEMKLGFLCYYVLIRRNAYTCIMIVRNRKMVP